MVERDAFRGIESIVSDEGSDGWHDVDDLGSGSGREGGARGIGGNDWVVGGRLGMAGRA